ncbi:hypothetical protein HOY82DRAFT_623959 [Tuber indicum]|nr:hypothetical protein HOY82DRAFT_623959 [Tuber indicum]
MSHSDITIQTSNLMLANTNGNSGGGGGGGGGGDTPIMPSGSAADLTNKVRIDTSKMKEEEESPSPTGGGDGAGIDAGGAQSGLAQDSLSFMQLKRLVVEAPRLKLSTGAAAAATPTCLNACRNLTLAQQPEYAFRYSSTDAVTAELNEWFSYSLANDLSLLLLSKQTFEETYPLLSLPPHQTVESLAGKRPSRWTASKDVKRRRFISRCADLLEHTNQRERVKGLEGLAYVVQGVFGETVSEDDHLDRVKKNVALVRQAGLVETLFNCVRGSVGRELEYAAAGSNSRDETKEGDRGWNRKELRYALTILYFLVEVTRRHDEDAEGAMPGMDQQIESLRDEIADLPGESGMLGFLAKTLGRLRWEDSVDLPLMNILLLTWKTMLLVFGEPDRHLAKVKTYARGLASLDPEVGKGVITASPLDYHVFRQDIMAKYPAYDPPKPLFPFELAANSFLPSSAVNTATGRTGGNGDVLLGGKGGGENLGSILNKAVHIATPAPSPPPSPGGVGGKGGKKQNYQTNNNFPFLYPPSSSSDVDKKFAGKCWWKEDDDTFSRVEGGGGVPTSIKEAGDLFSGRHLWDEREAFLKFQRGWDVDEEILKERKEIEGRDRRWEEKRLESVEEFYRAALPQLQSFVIVLLKVILANLNAPPMQPPLPPPPPGSQQVSFADKEEREADEKRRLDEADAQRIREITSKAVSAILMGMLKWFRVSHVLKFEYLTQLLLDSNYLPLVLRLLNQQDIVQTVTTKTDRKDMSFFNFCNLHSSHPKPKSKPPTNPNNSYLDSSPDEACPPPILRFQREQKEPDPPPPPPSSAPPSHPPEAITDFSWRNFFTAINFVRIMQKIVKNKSHRNLSLVQYKSSTILRKPLKCPQEDLRLYTLKVFKGQVPYCGRKWRQSNMRVITSIYLFCRPELKDDWLSGGDVDSEVEESLPQEQALRSLTHFYNVRRYPKSMGADMEMMEMERDFFRREIDKMEVGEWDTAGLEGWGG